MRVSLIWAMAENRTIGRNNKLPWHLPNDLKYFKQLTTGKPVIMGRKTYDSIGRPLPNRFNIVISRNPEFQAEGVKVVTTVDEAIELAEAECLISGSEEVIVMGGAEIYRLCLPRADRLYITFVHAKVDGDASFPDFDLSAYEEIGCEDFFSDDSNPYDYSFAVYDKK